MGKKSDAAKVSLAVAFLVARGGTAPAGELRQQWTTQRRRRPSYFGGFGLWEYFEGYLKVNTGFTGFYKYWKFDQEGAGR